MPCPPLPTALVLLATALACGCGPVSDSSTATPASLPAPPSDTATAPPDPGSTTPPGTGTTAPPPEPAVDPIPEGPVHRHAYYRYPTPPKGFTAAIGWAQAIHDDRFGPTSWAEVDWIRLYARVGQEDVVLTADEYTLPDTEWRWFGLYSRFPWFGTDDHEPMPVLHDPDEGVLVFNPSERFDRVWHWWNTANPRPLVPDGASHCWMEARVRIHGPALVQIGIDYWTTPTAVFAGTDRNNTEAGASDWALGITTNDWQVLRVGPPQP